MPGTLLKSIFYGFYSFLIRTKVKKGGSPPAVKKNVISTLKVLKNLSRNNLPAKSCFSTTTFVHIYQTVI